jgi:hypothetical protein
MFNCSFIKSKAEKLQEADLPVLQTTVLETPVTSSASPLYSVFEIQNHKLIPVPRNPLLPPEYSETIDYSNC